MNEKKKKVEQQKEKIRQRQRDRDPTQGNQRRTQSCVSLGIEDGGCKVLQGRDGTVIRGTLTYHFDLLGVQVVEELVPPVHGRVVVEVLHNESISLCLRHVDSFFVRSCLRV